MNLFTRDLNNFFGKELQFPHLQTGKTKKSSLLQIKLNKLKKYTLKIINYLKILILMFKA